MDIVDQHRNQLAAIERMFRATGERLTLPQMIDFTVQLLLRNDPAEDVASSILYLLAHNYGARIQAALDVAEVDASERIKARAGSGH